MTPTTTLVPQLRPRKRGRLAPNRASASAATDGMGPLSREYGYGADHVLAAKVVTADDGRAPADGRHARPPAGREGAYSLLALGVLAPGLEDVVPSTGLAVAHAVRPWTASATVLDWLGATATRDEVAGAWTPDVHERLVAVKRRVDRHDVFRVGHAVAP